MASERHLKVVDADSGEVLPACPTCQEFQGQLEGAEKEIRAWRTRYANLKRDRQAEAENHDLWGWAVALFHEWKIAANHPRSGWTADRFWICEPYLKSDGFVVCRWAVWGIAYMPNVKSLGNGYTERYDSWELCFRTRAGFERYVNRGHASPEAREQFEVSSVHDPCHNESDESTDGPAEAS